MNRTMVELITRLCHGLLRLLPLACVLMLSACANGPIPVAPAMSSSEADAGPMVIAEQQASAAPAGPAVVWALEAEEPAAAPATRGLLSLKPTPAPPPEAAWLVSRFQETDTWLKDYQEFRTDGPQWSRLLAKQIVERLRQEEDRVISMNRQLSHGQVQQLINQGLRYRIAGTIKQLRQEDRDADGYPVRYGSLIVTYQLERRLGGSMNVVQTDRLQADVRIADRVQPRHLELLIDKVAEQVVGAVQMSCAQDIMGMVE